MTAVIIYSESGNLLQIVRGIEEGLKEAGFRVQLREAKKDQSEPVVVASYDLVVVGSPVVGGFGGHVSSDIDMTLRRISRMDGKTTVAFVKSKLFGARKSLTRLMGLLERQGAWVQDFDTLSHKQDGVNFGRRMGDIVRNRP